MADMDILQNAGTLINVDISFTNFTNIPNVIELR